MTKEEFARRLKNACDSVISAEAELTEIDSRFGDADHGLTMTKVAKAIAQAVEESDGGIQSMLDDAAMAVMTLNGGSAVPLWNSWLDGLAEGAPEADALDVPALKAVFAAGLEELDDMSGAKVGDKTMMDAVIPASEAIAAYAGDSHDVQSVNYVAGGQAYLFTRGGVQVGRWEKPHPTHPLKLYTETGEEMTLNRGKTYLALVDNDEWSNFSY